MIILFLDMNDAIWGIFAQVWLKSDTQGVIIFFTSWEQNFPSQNFLWSCWYIRKKWDFDAGYGLNFSFYLFYTLCKIFTTIGAVLRKILGFLTWQVFNFLTFPIKLESAIFSLQNMQFTPNLSTIKILMIGTNLGVEKKIWWR